MPSYSGLCTHTHGPVSGPTGIYYYIYNSLGVDGETLASEFLPPSRSPYEGNWPELMSQRLVGSLCCFHSSLPPRLQPYVSASPNSVISTKMCASFLFLFLFVISEISRHRKISFNLYASVLLIFIIATLPSTI